MTEPATKPRRKKRKKKGAKRSSSGGGETIVQAYVPSPARARKLQRAMVGAAGSCVFGLGLVGTEASDVGAALVLAGVVGLAAAVHYYGRLGRDDATVQRAAGASDAA